MGLIRSKALIEMGEAVRIDERLQDAPDLKPVVRPAQPAQEPHVHHAIDIGADAVIQPNLVGGLGKKPAHHLDNVVPAENEARLAARGVELRELLSQQRQHEADLVAELPAGHEPREFCPPPLRPPLPKVSQTLGFLPDKVEAETRAVIPKTPPKSRQ